MASKSINFDERLRLAVRFFCRGRRDAVTGGESLDGFQDIIVDIVHT